MAEGDCGKPADNFQAGSRGICRGVVGCDAVDSGAGNCRAAELKRGIVRRKSGRRERQLKGECCASGALYENAVSHLQ